MFLTVISLNRISSSLIGGDTVGDAGQLPGIRLSSCWRPDRPAFVEAVETTTAGGGTMEVRSRPSSNVTLVWLRGRGRIAERWRLLLPVARRWRLGGGGSLEDSDCWRLVGSPCQLGGMSSMSLGMLSLLRPRRHCRFRASFVCVEGVTEIPCGLLLFRRVHRPGIGSGVGDLTGETLGSGSESVDEVDVGVPSSEGRGGSFWTYAVAIGTGKPSSTKSTVGSVCGF